jgi:ERCC4-type nuclease
MKKRQENRGKQGKQGKPMEIVCDDREKNERLIKEIEKQGIILYPKRLVCCDYLCKGKEGKGDWCIEMKSIEDFCLSIMDKRLDKQVERMRKMYGDMFIVVVYGRIEDRKTEINENCVVGKLVSLGLNRVRVICVDNERQVGFVLKRLIERIEKGEYL